MTRHVEGPEMLTPAEVAQLFGVHAKTVARWAKAGRIRCIRTPGITGYGHRRFYRDEIEALLRSEER